MPRQLNIQTLAGAARDYAANWGLPTRYSAAGNPIFGQDWVKRCLFNATYKDEFEWLVNNDEGMKAYMGGKVLSEFEGWVARQAPREDKVFQEVLRRKLAIDPDGNHIPGVRGTVKIGSRFVGVEPKVVKTKHFGEILLLKNRFWHVYAGEPEERELGHVGHSVDELPKDADPWPVDILNANNPNISAESAILMLDALADNFDEGTTAAEIRGRTGAQPADPDAAETGTLLFTCTMSDPAFGATVDDTDGTVSCTASAISDDTSADATNTVAYCRVAATGTGADDHLDIEAGTSASDINFNTTSIVTGATVSITSFVLNLSQGSTAT